MNSKEFNLETYFKESRKRIHAATERITVNNRPDYVAFEKNFPEKFAYQIDRSSDKYQYLNTRFHELFGYHFPNPEDIDIKHLAALIVHPNDLTDLLRIFSHFEHFASQRNVTELSRARLVRRYRLKDTNGVYREVLDTSSIISITPNGAIIELAGYYQFAPLHMVDGFTSGVILYGDTGQEWISFSPVPANDTHGLSAREVQIFKMLAAGKRNKEVAQELFLSIYTIETHRKNIMRKLGISSPIELVWKAIELNLVHNS